MQYSTRGSIALTALVASIQSLRDNVNEFDDDVIWYCCGWYPNRWRSIFIFPNRFGHLVVMLMFYAANYLFTSSYHIQMDDE
jgi:hypothetical protein